MVIYYTEIGLEVGGILEKRSKKLLELGLGALVIVVAIAMLFIYSDKRKPMDKNEEAIRIVVEQLFSGPDQEMVQMFQKFVQDLEEVTPKQLNTGISSDTNLYSDIDEKLAIMYAPYMTEEYYKGGFSRNYWSYYYVYSTATGYERKVNDIEITRSENDPINYSFIIHLNYGPQDGDKKEIKIEGSAQFAQEEGKISYLQIFDDHGLNWELRWSDEPKKDIYEHNYLFQGESEAWKAEYKVEGIVIFAEKDGKLEYESDSNGLLTVTYKGDLEELSNAKNMEISYKYSHGAGKQTSTLDNGVKQKVFTISNQGGNVITNPDEVIQVTITIDDNSQTLELVNELQPVHTTYPPVE